VVQEALVLPLLHDQHDTALFRPPAGAAGQVVQPFPRLLGPTTRWSDEVGLGQVVEHRVAADAKDVFVARCLEPVESVAAGKARIPAHAWLSAGGLLDAIEQRQQELDAARGCVRVPRAQLHADPVAGVQRGYQRMVAAHVVVAVPLRPRLVPVHFDRHRVDVDRGALLRETATVCTAADRALPRPSWR
jgi:hypothetical protein